MTDLRAAAQQALEALEALDAPPSGVVDHYELDRRKQALRAALEQPNEDYERGFVDGMSEQARRSVDRAVDALAQPPLTLDKLSNALVMSRVIDAAAIDDPEGYDDGVMLERVRGLHRRLAALAQQEPEQATVKESLPVGQEEPEGWWQSAPSPQVTQRIADMPMSEYRRGVHDGFKLGLREGRIKAEDEMREQQEQEPVEIKPPNPEGATQCIVRWLAETSAGWVGAWDREALERFTAHPPRREWRGLTDEELHGLYRRAGLEAYYPRDGAVQYEYERRFDAYARAIEAALKEKNQ
jgi:hypothetical protein